MLKRGDYSAVVSTEPGFIPDKQTYPLGAIFVKYRTRRGLVSTPCHGSALFKLAICSFTDVEKHSQDDPGDVDRHQVVHAQDQRQH